MTPALVSTPLLSVQYGLSPVRVSPQTPWTARLAGTTAVADFTFDGIVDQNAITAASCDIHQFEEDFFNAVYFIPNEISLASVATSTTVSVQVWNAFRTSRSLDNIVTTGFDGIELIGVQPPAVFLPLQLVDYDFIFDPVGPADIDASVRLLFQGGFEAALTATGTRSSQLFLVPNWREKVRRTYTALSDIATGRTQRESRRQLRGTPRIRIRYTHTGFSYRLTPILRFYQSNPDLLTVMPDWPSSAFLAAPAPAGGSSFTVTETRPWLVPGQGVFVHTSADKNSEEDFFLTTIESVVGNVVTTQAESPRDWPSGARIYRALSGRVRATTPATMLTNNLMEIVVDFEVDPGQENLYDPGVPDQTFQGRELFTTEETWSDSIDLSWVKDRISNDAGRGRIQEVSFFEYTPEILQLSFDQFTLDDIFELERFFLRQRGRVGEFWRSARLPDLALVRDIQVGQTSIEVEGENVAEIYRPDPSKVAVEIELLDGTRFQRAILAFDSLLGVDTTIINFNEEWDIDIPIDMVRRVSWLNVWRLTSDELVVEWTTDSVASINLALRSLVVEDVETIPEDSD